MKRLSLAIVMLATLGAALVAAGNQTQDPARLLKAAMDLEMVDRNLPAAIEQYKRVAASGDRAFAAQALLRMAECYEKLGSQEAQKIYAQLIKEYGDQAAVVAEARTKLAQPLRPGGTPAALAVSPFEVNSSRVPWAGVLSPDGRVVAAAQAGQSAAAILAVDLATKRERLVPTTCNGQANSLEWSPDSRHLAYLCRVSPNANVLELHVLSLGNSQERTLDRYDRENVSLGFVLAWSPDSQRLLFVRRRNPNLDSRTEEVKLATVTGAVSSISLTTEGEFTSFAWSPDSLRVALHTADRKARRAEVSVLTLEGNRVSPVTLPDAPWDSQRFWRTLRGWTPAGDLIVEDMRPGYAGTAVFAVQMSGGALRKVCEGPMTTNGWTCGEIASDGRRMLVRDSGSRRLAVRDLSTGIDRAVTVGAGDEIGGAFSPDGRMISFAANRTGRWSIYVVPLNQIPVSDPVYVTDHDGPPPVLLQWSRNGTLMAGRNGGGTRVFRVTTNPEHATATEFAAQINTDGRRKTATAVSPDSKSIAIWSRDGARDGLAIVDRNGAGERLVLEYRLRDMAGGIGVHLAWTSSSEVVFYDWADDRGRWGLTAVDVNRGTQRRLSHGEALGANRWPSWGFGATKQEVIYGDGRAVRVRSLVDGTDRILLNGQADQATIVNSFAVSADGSRVAYGHPAFTDPVRGNVPGQLRVVQTDGSGNRALTAAAVGSVCSWSPNGRFLVYFDLDRQYRVLNVESGETAPLLKSGDPLHRAMQNDNPLCWNQGVAWAPDGSFVLLTTLQIGQPQWAVFDGVTYDVVVRAMDVRRRP